VFEAGSWVGITTPPRTCMGMVPRGAGRLFDEPRVVSS